MRLVGTGHSPYLVPLLRATVVLVLLSFSALCVSRAEAAPSLRFEATSDVGDSVGGGRTRLYTELDVDFYGPFFDQSTPGRVDYAMFFLGPTGPTFEKNAIIQVSTRQLGHELRPGHYFPVERAPVASSGVAGLDISVDYGGCNTISGAFTIRTIRWSAPGVLAYFDMDFEQHCNGEVPALRGRFAFDASGTPITFAVQEAIAVPMHGATHLILAVTLLLTAWVRLRQAVT